MENSEKYSNQELLVDKTAKILAVDRKYIVEFNFKRNSSNSQAFLLCQNQRIEFFNCHDKSFLFLCIGENEILDEFLIGYDLETVRNVKLDGDNCHLFEFFEEFDIKMYLVDEKLETDLNYPLYIGHRGFGETNKRKLVKNSSELYETQFYVENTEDAINQSYANNAKWVEIDVQMTKDDVLIVFHDFFIDDEGIKKFVSLLTYDEINHIYQKNTNKTELSLHTLMKFETLLEICKPDLGINVEIKYAALNELEGNKYILDARKIVEEIKIMVNKKKKTNVFYSSFNPQIIYALKTAKVDHPIFLLVCNFFNIENLSVIEYLQKMFCIAHELNLTGIILDIELCNEIEVEVIDKARSLNLKIMAYGSRLDDFKYVNELIAIGINGIITDRIELFKVDQLRVDNIKKE